MTWTLNVITEPERTYTYRLVLPRFPKCGGRMIHLPRPPVLAFRGVYYYMPDHRMVKWGDSRYLVDHDAARIILRSEKWPETADRPDAVHVLYTAGHNPHPSYDRDPLGGF